MRDDIGSIVAAALGAEHHAEERQGRAGKSLAANAECRRLDGRILTESS